MATRDEVGQAIRELKTSTGWTWRQVADQLGTTPEYARKLARGQGSTGAGAALRANIEREARTGRPQAPVQRRTAAGTTQRVRQRGGRPSEPAQAREAAPRRAFHVERSRFAGPAGRRDGWRVRVEWPDSRREDGRQAINDAIRRAAQGRRRVAFVVTVGERDQRGKTDPGMSWTVELGARGGYDASRVLAGIRAEGFDTLSWLIDQGLNRYRRHAGAEEGDVTQAAILAVEVIALP